jgi:hypothetical protein
VISMFIFADLLTNGQKGMLMFTHWAAFFSWEKKILNRANRQMLQYLTWMPINCYAKKTCLIRLLCILSLVWTVVLFSILRVAITAFVEFTSMKVTAAFL